MSDFGCEKCGDTGRLDAIQLCPDCNKGTEEPDKLVARIEELKGALREVLKIADVGFMHKNYEAIAHAKEVLER